MKISRQSLLLILALSLFFSTATATKPALPPTRGIVVNLVEWDGGELPAVYERTDQLPFTREDLLQLVQSDFKPDQIAQMVSERRYAGDASAEGLIALKQAGLDPLVIQAISKHALAPNQSLNLTIYLTFDGPFSNSTPSLSLRHHTRRRDPARLHCRPKHRTRRTVEKRHPDRCHRPLAPAKNPACHLLGNNPAQNTRQQNRTDFHILAPGHPSNRRDTDDRPLAGSNLSNGLSSQFTHSRLPRLYPLQTGCGITEQMAHDGHAHGMRVAIRHTYHLSSAFIYGQARGTAPTTSAFICVHLRSSADTFMRILSPLNKEPNHETHHLCSNRPDRPHNRMRWGPEPLQKGLMKTPKPSPCSMTALTKTTCNSSPKKSSTQSSAHR